MVPLLLKEFGVQVPVTSQSFGSVCVCWEWDGMQWGLRFQMEVKVLASAQALAARLAVLLCHL